ncbi:MAG: hypothetical protein MUF15_23875 [Acidobacteria bacterium]|jgi:hypothetical protein|nr:hypothetical protein [Acidobacteriota bacterium]
MELIEIAKQIEIKINELDASRKVIMQRAKEKAEAIAAYEKAIAITIIGMRNGMSYDLDGEHVDNNMPVTLIEKIARGICYKEKLAAEQAEAMYKACVVNIETTMAQLNALQTLNRYLDKL